MSVWTEKNQTLSHKNAMKEYGLTEKEIISGMKNGKLEYRQNYAHGNPYFRLLRHQVKDLALELHGDKGYREQEGKHRLKEINREINSLRRRLKSLEKEKEKLLKV